MHCLKLTLAYDGSDFAGWQHQPERRTVQAVLEEALAGVAGKCGRVLASGRTDAGVHALGQVVSARIESRLGTEDLRRALNAVLPPDVAVLAVEETTPQFHPIRDVQSKRYAYLICDGPVRPVFWRRYGWHFRGGRLDAGAMQRAAAGLEGTHDFSSFQTSGAPRRSSVRTVRRLSVRRVPAGQGGAGGPPFGLLLSPEGLAPADWIIVEIEADGFLYNMARAIVGTLVEVGRGARPEHWPAEVLRACDRRQAGPTAPPQGLFLIGVRYRAPGADNLAGP